MCQRRPKCKIFGQARRPAPTKACRGDSLWSPVSREFDFDVALPTARGALFEKTAPLDPPQKLLILILIIVNKIPLDHRVF
jgi:hypothetical protein